MPPPNNSERATPAPRLFFVHDEQYAEAVANRRHTVYGRPLRPYCLWHRVNLELAQSPVLLGAPLTPLNLWTAVQICASEWSPDFTSPNLTPPGAARFAWLSFRYRFAAQVQAFQTYLDDYSRGPKLWESANKGAAPERDFDDNLETALYLVTETGLTWRDIWTMPIGLLSWSGVGVRRLRGQDIPIWTPMHEAAFAEHKKQREAKLDDSARQLMAQDSTLTFETARKQASDTYWAGVNAAKGIPHGR